jgi:hypothetical protein
MGPLPAKDDGLRDFITLLSDSDDIEVTFLGSPELAPVRLAFVISHGPSIMEIDDAGPSVFLGNVNVCVAVSAPHDSKITIIRGTSRTHLTGNHAFGIEC